jgi:hypothetical protein
MEMTLGNFKLFTKIRVKFSPQSNPYIIVLKFFEMGIKTLLIDKFKKDYMTDIVSLIFII